MLPQSSAALLRVLARRIGMDIEPHEVPCWWRRDDGMWMLGWADGVSCPFNAPTLAPDMTPMRALAECFVWLARVERVAQCEWTRVPDGEYPPDFVGLAERELDLPTWAVEVSHA